VQNALGISDFDKERICINKLNANMLYLLKDKAPL